MFRNTYVCESTFSTMKQVKSQNKNRSETLINSLQLATTNTGITEGTIVSEKLRPQAVAYAENSRGGTKFCHNRVTSQINFRTTILGGPGACPRENFAKLHKKYANYT